MKFVTERMLTKKVWDHAIDLKEMFKPWNPSYNFAPNTKYDC